MLTVSSPRTVPTSPRRPEIHLSQNETTVSDFEISRRVMQIRAGWSLSERVRRRREAENRFADLMTSLGIDSDAA